MKVITYALLFFILSGCNSAKDSATIQTSIDSEAQLQKMNVTLYYNGERYSINIREDYCTTPKNEESKVFRRFLLSIWNQMNEIDTLTADMIQSIDQMKVSLLKSAGKNYTIPSQHSVLPNDFDFSNITTILDTETDFDLFNRSGKLDLFNQIKAYRKEMVKIVSRFESRQVAVSDINDYKDEVHLRQKVDTQISSKVPNPMEDRQAVTDLYTLLTLPRHFIRNGEKISWKQAVFQHSNLIGALTQLTILQNKILNARSFALAHISSRYNSCGYSFDKIIPFSNGPSLIHEGESTEITIGMVAFDSYNQPEVVIQSGGGKVLKPQNGICKVWVKPKKGLQIIKGSVSIRDKSGVKKTEYWEHHIQVLPKK
jgi:hypothetical protein